MTKGMRLRKFYKYKIVILFIIIRLFNCLILIIINIIMYSNNLKNYKFSLWINNQLLIFFCLIGLGLSLYTYIIELSTENINNNNNNNYKAYCDISQTMSCSKVINSSYGKGLGIFNEHSVFYKPNSFFGIVFYSMIATFSLSNSIVALYGSAFLILLSNFLSIYFGYIFYLLDVICIVCLGIHLVNMLNLIFIRRKAKIIQMIKEHASENCDLKKLN